MQIIFSGPVFYINPAPGALIPVSSGDTLTYNIPDFGNTNFNTDFAVIMQTDTTAQAGNQICFSVIVTPTAGDIYPVNNSLTHCFTVMNSFDPNFKEVFPAGNIDTSQQWLTYTINFQNTGTATAQHIYILDTLDNNLDESAFTLLAYSHQPLTQIIGNVVRFNFPNINLPDSIANEPDSHGYVQYKIKLKDSLPVGTTIKNTANIIFDFNAPVVTNTVTNQIIDITGINVFNIKNLILNVFPNPTTNQNLRIIYLLPQNKAGFFEIFDINGRKVYSQRLPQWSTLQQIKLPDVSNGLYNCVITSGNDRASKKIAVIKE